MNNIDPKYKPISMWGYFGYNILYSIPVIGIIVLIVNAFASYNVNVKNYARSYFCGFIIVIIVLIIIMISGVGLSILEGLTQ